MDFSVIICTYNRSKSLSATLSSLNSQNLPDNFKWEVLVVDNNSTDNTKEVVDKFIEGSKLNLRYVKESKQGLSYARNKGIMGSKGKYVAFTDDDAIVDKQWIGGLYETFRRYGCDCVGGRIYLKPVKKLPRWLKKELWGFLGFLDYGDVAFEIRDERLFGGNIAFSREILNKSGFFNTGYGRTGSIPIGGEEAELLNRILEMGVKAYYCPDAKVYHIIEGYKLQKKNFRRLHYYEGMTAGKFYDVKIKRQICGVPFFIFPQFLRSIMKYIKNPTLRMQMNIWWFLGFMKGKIKSRSNIGD